MEIAQDDSRRSRNPQPGTTAGFADELARSNRSSSTGSWGGEDDSVVTFSIYPLQLISCVRVK